uniref:Chemokine interleukin-8-like domain-containing protein n=1 Tax=Sinocyclocheilus anshuiensis TaxID=1608454 RepID=A0A671KYQ5_9TELE
MRSLISVLFLVLFCSVQMISSVFDAAQSKCCGELTNVKIRLKWVAVDPEASWLSRFEQQNNSLKDY